MILIMIVWKQACCFELAVSRLNLFAGVRGRLSPGKQYVCFRFFIHAPARRFQGGWLSSRQGVRGPMSPGATHDCFTQFTVCQVFAGYQPILALGGGGSPPIVEDLA